MPEIINYIQARLFSVLMGAILLLTLWRIVITARQADAARRKEARNHVRTD